MIILFQRMLQAFHAQKNHHVFRSMGFTLCLIGLFVSVAPIKAADVELAHLFERHGIQGTLILASLAEKPMFVHNDQRAQQRFPVASTFKILNTLIALEEQVITDEHAQFTWDGQKHVFEAWNQDLNLTQAFNVSCVWCYQQLAQQIETKRYQEYLQRLQYGHLQTPFDATTFWLDGSLTISAMEQISFLRKLYLHAYPDFSASSYAVLQTIMREPESTDFRISAKTGWSRQAQPGVGWYVGYVETEDDVWFFASNIDIDTPSDLPLRRMLVLKALQLKGIIGNITVQIP